MSLIDFIYQDILTALFIALWIMLPAYIPNSAAAVFGGGRPIDSGKNLSDGRRLFGDGKTWRGLIGGILCGIVIGLIQIYLQGVFDFQIHTVLSVVLLSAGALLGDLVKSFFKRRLNKKSGEEWLIADQYDLVAGAIVLLLIFDFQWLTVYITPVVFIWILIATPLLHRITNIAGYMIGVKDVPW